MQFMNSFFVKHFFSNTQNFRSQNFSIYICFAQNTDIAILSTQNLNTSIYQVSGHAFHHTQTYFLFSINYFIRGCERMVKDINQFLQCGSFLTLLDKSCLIFAKNSKGHITTTPCMKNKTFFYDSRYILSDILYFFRLGMFFL